MNRFLMIIAGFLFAVCWVGAVLLFATPDPQPVVIEHMLIQTTEDLNTEIDYITAYGPQGGTAGDSIHLEWGVVPAKVERRLEVVVEATGGATFRHDGPRKGWLRFPPDGPGFVRLTVLIKESLVGV